MHLVCGLVALFSCPSVSGLVSLLVCRLLSVRVFCLVRPYVPSGGSFVCFTPSENKSLAENVHALYLSLRRARGGRVGWAHVKGHSGRTWNELAVESAVIGDGSLNVNTP